MVRMVATLEARTDDSVQPPTFAQNEPDAVTLAPEARGADDDSDDEAMTMPPPNEAILMREYERALADVVDVAPVDRTAGWDTDEIPTMRPITPKPLLRSEAKVVSDVVTADLHADPRAESA
jgi:hypothetical protein